MEPRRLRDGQPVPVPPEGRAAARETRRPTSYDHLAGATDGEGPFAERDWPDLLGAGLASAVGAGVDTAGGVADHLAGEGGRKTQWRQALNWFLSSYPLLGALAAAFKLVEDSEVCHLHGIGVAAISPVAAELYVNPLCGLEDGEHRFVIAHELLHAGLRHDTRGGGRDPSWSSQESHEFATLAMCDLV